MYIADQWTNYKLIDTDSGKRLEDWAGHVLVRPDPQVIWKDTATSPLWKKADAVYKRSKSGGGAWTHFKKLPDEWTLDYESLGLTFVLKPMGFKHTGVFPEQAVNWEWFSKLIRNAGRPIKVLNLFAYTGGATLAAAKAGASVVHVDASQGMNRQAQKNAELSGLAGASIRYITDDCAKFVQRELRRGNKYDAIIMDPPSYGRGTSGELWKLEDMVFDFVKMTAGLLSDTPLFFLINSYTTGLSPSTMGCILSLALKDKAGLTVACDEVGLPILSSGTVLPCGAAARATFAGEGCK